MVGEVKRFGGRAGDGAGIGAERVLGPQRGRRGAVTTDPAGSASGGGVQLKAVRRDGWTPARRALFIETLQATANVSEAARVVGKSVGKAYYLRRRDPGFAREWAQALSVGYAELEALLLRQSLFGTETITTTQDGEGVVRSRTVRRGHPNAVAIRLLIAHRKSVEETRDREMVERPDGPDAVDRLRLALDMVRARQLVSQGDEEEA